jgi:glycosyltransferase (activator-dependent family)
VRVLFVAFPWKTHFYPLVPLAWALQTAGHEVRVASEPQLTETITGAGLVAVAVGSSEPIEQRIWKARQKGDIPEGEVTPPFSLDSLYEVGKNQDRRERLSWEKLTWLHDNVVVPRTKLLNDGMVDDLVAYCRSWEPDLVLWDVVSNAAAVAATAVGAPHARLVAWLDLAHRLRGDYLWAKAQQPEEDRRDGLQDWYTQWAEKYGCEFSEEMISGHFAINTLPASYRLEPHERTLAMRYVPYNGPAEMPTWLYDPPRAPRVVMTFGISMKEMPELQVISVAQIQDVLDSLADLDIELVVTLPTKLRDELGRIPKNTRIVEFVALHLIIPSCSVVIHHGAVAGFSDSLRNGVPQLLISKTIDARPKTELIQESNLGLAVPPDEVTGPRVREALVQLLEDPSFRAGADQLRQEVLAQPSPNDLVPELEKLAAEYRADGHRS